MNPKKIKINKSYMITLLLLLIIIYTISLATPIFNAKQGMRVGGKLVIQMHSLNTVTVFYSICLIINRNLAYPN